MVALVSYGITRLATCIHDLREAGFGIKTEMKKDATGHKYAQYTIEYDENAKAVS